MDRITVMPNFATAQTLDELKRMLTKHWSEMANLVNNTFTLYVQNTQPTIPNNTTSLWQDTTNTPNDYYWVGNFGGTHQIIRSTSGLQKARVYNTSTQALTTGDNKIVWSNDSFDTHTITDLDNDRIKPTIPGYYLFSGVVGVSDLPAAADIFSVLYKNGNMDSRGARWVNAGAAPINVVSPVVDLTNCNGSTDYIELHAAAGGNCTTEASVCYLSVVGPF